MASKTALTSKKYKTASVMYSRWYQTSGGIEAGIESDIKQLTAVLTTEYHYTAINYVIPAKATEATINAEIEKAAQGKTSDHLFVFYYAGHGGRGDEAKDPLKLKGGSSGEYAVRYLPIHEKLVSLACDVLVILDCCEATDVLDKAISSPSQVLPGQKKFNLIGACMAYDSTSGDAHNTMTSRLCKAITSMKGLDTHVWEIMGEMDILTSQDKNDFRSRYERLFGAQEPPYEGWIYIPINRYVHFGGLGGPGQGDILLHKL